MFFLKKSQEEVSHKSEIISCFSEKHANRIRISSAFIQEISVISDLMALRRRDGKGPDCALEAPLKYLQICSQLF